MSPAPTTADRLAPRKTRKTTSDTPHRGTALGLRANLGQFSLLMLVNAFVGAMVGLERAVVPLLGARVFGLASATAALSFLVTFGIVKALANLFAGRLADQVGRKGVLVAGWIAALPVPLLLIAAPAWGWVVAANVLLGVNQGLCWSTTVVIKIDLVGPARRGLAMGLNEAAGYGAVALAAAGAGFLAATYGLRPAPFLPGVAFAVAGLLLSLLFVHESHGHARLEAGLPRSFTEAAPTTATFGEVVRLVSWRDRALSAVSQAGLVNNLNDGLAWGLFPLIFAAARLSLTQIGLLAGLYPAVWGAAQLATGALSDRMGRKPLIVVGMWLQAGALALVPLVRGFAPWAVAMVLLGLGTALVYPTLLAAVSDVAHPSWRASAVGVYRLWRDGGYVVGALLAGALADLWGPFWAVAIIAALTFASGAVALLRMYETHCDRRVW
jgi:MFS family permease